MKGLSARNVKYMRYFAEHCPKLQLGQQPADQLPWFHIVTLLTKSLPSEREWYAVHGDEKLKVIAAELITQVKKSVTIDWTLRESARAKIKVMVKRILNKYGYPPDLQEDAVKTVLLQAELLCAEWA